MVTPRTDHLRFNPEDAKKMDPTDLVYLNVILVRIQAMGLDDGPISIYDQIGIRPDDRVIYTPRDSLLVASVEESAGEYVSSPERHAPNTRAEENPEEFSAAHPQVEPEHAMEARSGSLAAAQDTTHDGPDSRPLGMKFSIPPAPTSSTAWIIRDNPTSGWHT